MADAFSIKFDSTALEGKLDALAEEAKTHVRAAAQAGAQVFYDEALLRVPVKTGTLRSSIYQVYSKENSTPEHATYHVSWNRSKAPHGHLVEFGTSRAPAHPFLRPSFDAKAQLALEAAKAKFLKGIAPAIA